jgi:hypothetical protein
VQLLKTTLPPAIREARFGEQKEHTARAAAEESATITSKGTRGAASRKHRSLQAPRRPRRRLVGPSAPGLHRHPHAPAGNEVTLEDLGEVTTRPVRRPSARRAKQPLFSRTFPSDGQKVGESGPWPTEKSCPALASSLPPSGRSGPQRDLGVRRSDRPSSWYNGNRTRSTTTFRFSLAGVRTNAEARGGLLAGGGRGQLVVEVRAHQG